jgi:beta-lactamase class C
MFNRRSDQVMKLVAASLSITLIFGLAGVSRAATDEDAQKIIRQHLHQLLPADQIGAIAVAIRMDGRTVFFDSGLADVAKKRPVTSDSLFNLASISKVFDATLLALLAKQGEINLDDPVADYVTELQRGGDIRRVTLGQLATHTAGLNLPPDGTFTLPQFMRYLNRWTANKAQQPGKEFIYSHASYMLLHLALERRFGTPYPKLLEERLLNRIVLPSTTLPMAGVAFRGELPAELRSHAVQGYSDKGNPIGKQGDQQSLYHWRGTGQMYSSTRDLAAFLAANLGERDDPELRAAIEFTHAGVFRLTPRVTQALAWELRKGDFTIVDKYGGMNNSSVYIGIIPSKKTGIAILLNRGGQDVEKVGRQIMVKIAGLTWVDEEDE